MCFEEPSRIGIKILFIKIAGVFDRGEITGAILAVRITKRHDAGLELNYTHNGEILCRVKLFIINRKKGPDFTKNRELSNDDDDDGSENVTKKL